MVTTRHKKYAASKSAWYQKNKERILKSKKEWRQKVLGTLEYRYKRAIQTSRQRGIPFLLSFDRFKEVVSTPCYYCGFKLCSQVKEGSGIDRIDSRKGYEVGNVISCGHRCNLLKNEDLTVEEAKAAISAILTLRLVKEYERESQVRRVSEGVSEPVQDLPEVRLLPGEGVGKARS